MERGMPEVDRGVPGPTTATPSALQQPDIVERLVLLLHDDDEALRSMKGCCTVWRDVLGREHLWKSMSQARFGQHVAGLHPLPAQCPVGPWQAQYLRLSGRRNDVSNSRVTEVHVCETTGPRAAAHVRTKPCKGAVAARCLVLRNVRWMDLSTTFYGVTPGMYTVVWRVRVGRDVGEVDTVLMDLYAVASRDACGHTSGRGSYQAVNEVEHPVGLTVADPNEYAVRDRESTSVHGTGGLSARVAEVDCQSDEWTGMICKTQVTRKQLLAMAKTSKTGWLNLEVGRFRVPHGFVLDIRTRLFDLNPWWQHSLTFDQVRLEQLTETGETVSKTTMDSAQSSRGARKATAGSGWLAGLVCGLAN